MQIVGLDPTHVEALHALYVKQVARVPHCRFAGDAARFHDDVLGLTPRSLLFDPIEKSQTFVALEAGAPQGFATLVTTQDKDEAGNTVEKQSIAGLFVANAAAGNALIAACEAAATVRELGAFAGGHGKTPMHSYNMGWDGLSDRVPLVAQLLAKHGYTPNFRELHLMGPLATGAHEPRALPTGITFERKIDPPGYQGDSVLRAIDGATRVGVCCYSKLSLLTNDPAASQIGYIWWLHVEEAYRKQGIARALMTATVQELVALGCTSWWLTTTADNWRAQALYLSLDFEVVDCSTSFRKQLRV